MWLNKKWVKFIYLILYLVLNMTNTKIIWSQKIKNKIGNNKLTNKTEGEVTTWVPWRRRILVGLGSERGLEFEEVEEEKKRKIISTWHLHSFTLHHPPLQNYAPISFFQPFSFSFSFSLSQLYHFLT